MNLPAPPIVSPTPVAGRRKPSPSPLPSNPDDDVTFIKTVARQRPKPRSAREKPVSVIPSVEAIVEELEVVTKEEDSDTWV